MSLLLLSQEKKVRDVAKEMGIPKSTIGDWSKRFKDGKSMERSSGSGRPKKLTNFEQREVILNAKRSPFTTRDEIRINVGREDVSKNAISRVIKNGNELASYYQTTKPYVSKINQKKG
jgi:transposase